VHARRVIVITVRHNTCRLDVSAPREVGAGSVARRHTAPSGPRRCAKARWWPAPSPASRWWRAGTDPRPAEALAKPDESSREAVRRAREHVQRAFEPVILKGDRSSHRNVVGICCAKDALEIARVQSLMHAFIISRTALLVTRRRRRRATGKISSESPQAVNPLARRSALCPSTGVTVGAQLAIQAMRLDMSQLRTVSPTPDMTDRGTARGQRPQ